MKRSPLKRGSPLTRSTRVRASNPARRAKTFARNFGERGEAVRAMTCLVQQAVERLNDNAFRAWVHSSGYCSPPYNHALIAGWKETFTADSVRYVSSLVQAAHVRARGMGGAKGDRRDLVPLCAKHHAEAGEHRTSARAAFEARYKLDLVAEAERIAVELDERGLA